MVPVYWYHYKGYAVLLCYLQELFLLRNQKNMNMNNFKKGDVIKCFRGLYWHFGVYVGNNKVIHFSTRDNGDFDVKNANIIETSLDQFSQGCHTSVDNSVPARFSSDEIVNRAKRKLGTESESYNIITNNCEHFANWCKSGRAVSYQVENVVTHPLEHIAYELVQINQLPLQKIEDLLGSCISRLLA